MKSLIRLVQYLYSRSKGTVVLAAVTGTIAAASTVVFFRLLNYALNHAAHTSATIIIGILGVSIFTILNRLASQMLITRLGQDTIYNLRLRFVRKILATPLRHLESLGSNQLIASLSTDTVALSGAIISVPSVIIDMLTVFIVCAYVTSLDNGMYVILAGCGLVLMSFGYYGPSKRATRHFRRVRSDWGVVYGHFMTLFDGIKELKTHRGRREKFLRNFESDTSMLQRNNVSGNYIQAVAQGGSNIFFYVFLISVLFILPLYVRISTQMLFTYLFVSFYLMGPVRHLMAMVPTLSNAKVSIEKLEEMEQKLDHNVDDVFIESDSTSKMEPLQPWESLELRKVVHNYQVEDGGATFTLGPIDLTIRQGELVFLTGGNGSGKTTLVKLLTGLYIPDDGEIYLGGRQITDDNTEFYRQHFSVSFSDCYIFNTLLGLESPALDALAHEHLRDLQLADKVKVTDGKFSTTALSQGQRKRLALLTIHLEDRPICIFDEWAAEQDPFFREMFYTKIIQELKAKGKTVIVISHDDRYYHLGDRVIRLDYGHICQDEPTFAIGSSLTAACVGE
jgi:putative ATP-binding cassette transporter